MKLISDIIEELMDSKTSLSSPLLKTKVLATKIENKLLLDWVNNEINGYDHKSQIPDYRVINCNVFINYILGFHQYTNQSLMISSFPEALRKSLDVIVLNNSIAALENLSNSPNTSDIESIPSGDDLQRVQKHLRSNGNPNINILQLKKSTSVNAITQVIFTVRSKLLDLMLEIDNKFGNITDFDSIKSNNDKITTIMNNTVINNNGDGNILNTGDKAKIDAKITIKKGDKENLKKKLLKEGLATEDVFELATIIDEEEPIDGKFGNKVNGWVTKMLGKTLDGSWQIGIGAAGSMLADIIAKYYGIK
jgi:hypothetical protein